MENDILTVLERLIAFRTTADRPEEVSAAYDYIESLFAGAPVEFRRFERNGKVSHVTFPKGQDWKSVQVLLNGHLDVVPAPEEAFVPRREGEKLYGRGASDMKGGLAALIFGLRAALRENPSASGALLITADEELGGVDGVKYLIETEQPHPGFVLIADGPRSEGFRITVKEKGGTWIELIARGRSAHAARPWLGKNALDLLAGGIEKIKQHVGAIEADAWKSTYNLARIETSNNAPNVVPDNARAVVDIRFTEALAATPEDMLAQIQNLVPDLEVNALTRVSLLVTDPENRLVQSLKEIADKAVGTDVPLAFGHGASDGRYFSAQGIAVALIGVVGADWHTPTEWVDMKTLPVLQDIVQEFISQNAS